MPSDPQAASLVGRRLGVYQVVTPLGAGGIGEVYRARDTRLGRDVALKVLPREFTADPDRLARFEREARAVWRSDGQELFYLSVNQNDAELDAVRTGDLNRAGGVPAPVLLFRACPQTAVAGPMDGAPWDYVYDTDDGKRFLVNCKAHPQDRFGVLLN